MENNYIKAFFTAVFSVLSSLFGILALPVILMVTCNVIDYITGIMAAHHRGQEISSYKGLDGICKKICMWLLVGVGAIIDQLVLYASDTVGITLPFTFLVACVVTIWIICNEIISILENIKDMGVKLPGFLQPLVENIKSQVESKTEIKKEDEDVGDE
jgi:toxin secretion/phage lysis holin